MLTSSALRRMKNRSMGWLEAKKSIVLRLRALKSECSACERHTLVDDTWRYVDYLIVIARTKTTHCHRLGGRSK
jgi:hypothetical protein